MTRTRNFRCNIVNIDAFLGVKVLCEVTPYMKSQSVSCHIKIFVSSHLTFSIRIRPRPLAFRIIINYIKEGVSCVNITF